MTVILWAFTLFHVAVAMACLAAAIRLLTPSERNLWRSPVALMIAELLVWVYPVAALVAVKSAWDAYAAGNPLALLMLLAPIGWLVLMGIAFAIVDFADDGIIGNARRSS